MKKVLLLLILLMLPSMVDAKEYCKVVSGNGKDIGSEIACGSEHFYILDSNTDEIKMLAKYNLYTGVSIEKIKIERNDGDTREDFQYCDDLATSMNGFVKSDLFYSNPGYCFIAKMAEREDKRILQSEDAKSAHWDSELNYLYPQVGDVYIKDYFYNQGYPEIIEGQIENTNFYDYSLDLSTYNDSSELFTFSSSRSVPQGLSGPLYFYKRELEKMDFSIRNISMLSLTELNNIVKKVNNKSLPFKTWSDDPAITYGLGSSANYGYLAEFGSLKEYVPNNYSWLYSTTYWNSSIYTSDRTFSGRYYIFTAQQGKICGAGFLYCAPETKLGCGVRPVITIPNELQYLISTKTDGNGTIEVVENSLGGEAIQFKVIANKGYKLGSIVIRTDSGEEVEFSEGEITKNDDGTISIDKNKFTMPFENVTIEARWSLDIMNPKTGRNFIILFTSMILLINGTIIYRKRRVS